MNEQNNNLTNKKTEKRAEEMNTRINKKQVWKSKIINKNKQI